MKLILAIVSNDDASAVSAALTKNNFYMTRLATTGGFLRAGNTTIIVGTEDELVDKCIAVIGKKQNVVQKLFHQQHHTMLVDMRLSRLKYKSVERQSLYWTSNNSRNYKAG